MVFFPPFPPSHWYPEQSFSSLMWLPGRVQSKHLNHCGFNLTPKRKWCGQEAHSSLLPGTMPCSTCCRGMSPYAMLQPHPSFRSSYFHGENSTNFWPTILSPLRIMLPFTEGTRGGTSCAQVQIENRELGSDPKTSFPGSQQLISTHIPPGPS